MPINIIGSGLIAHIARKSIAHSVCDSDEHTTPYHRLQYSFIGYHRALWLQKQNVWVEHPSSVIWGMRVVCDGQQTVLRRGVPLGYMVHHETWRTSLAVCPEVGHVSPRGIIVAAGASPRWILPPSIKTYTHHFNQWAHIAYIKHTFSHQHIATQLFEKDSIWAILPLADPHVSILIVTSLSAIWDGQGCRALYDIVGEYDIVDQADPYVLKSTLRTPAVYKNTMLLGDTRMKLHPLAGQGLNISLYALEDLVMRLESSRDALPDIFHQHIQATQRHMQRVFIMTQSLAYTTRSRMLRTLLALSVSLLEHQPDVHTACHMLADPLMT